MSLLKRAGAEIETRTGALTAWRWLADERIPGGARWAYVFGSLLAGLLLAQAASGIVLALDYAPTTDSAWESTARIMEQAPWGPLVRGIHHHGASFLVIALVLHVMQVAWFGAYKKPREANWWTGLGLGLIILAFAFTGYLLPWDQTAYYATKVGLNIMRSVPLVGSLQADLLQGGEVLGNLTLTRFYTIHAILLPAALGGLLLLHLAMFRRHGITPPAHLSEEELAEKAEPFWPSQAAHDAVAAAGVIALLVAVAWFLPAPLGAKADASVPFDARPEWYFYWLFQLLHWFEPPIEWMGTIVIPGGLLLLLAGLPFLDRAKTRNWRERLLPIGALFGALGAVGVLTLMVIATDDGGDEPDLSATLVAGVTSGGGDASAATLEAAMLYGRYCAECHGLHGEPLDPDATDMRSDDFARMAKADFEAIVAQILEGGEMMEAFDQKLSPEEARLIVREILIKFPERAAKD
jgi:ubiquinol-cytochrome c reductase cytochrome b subunit